MASIPKSAPGFPLFDAEIGDKRRLSIPKPALARVDWATQITPGTAATFEMLPGGLAQLRPGKAYADAIASMGEDADARRDLSLVMELARWERPNRITVPRAVALHVLGHGRLSGPIYVFAAPDLLEIWSVELRERRLAEARHRIADHLTD